MLVNIKKYDQKFFMTYTKMFKYNLIIERKVQYSNKWVFQDKLYLIKVEQHKSFFFLPQYGLCDISKLYF